MNTTSAHPTHPATGGAKGKHLLFNHETVLIISFVVIAIVLLSFLFSLLWSYFRVGFTFLLAWLLIVIIRKTESWKLGVECFYITAFLFSYAFSSIATFILCATAILFVVKVFRPDELEGALTQLVALGGTAFSTRIVFNMFGAGITETQLLISGMALYLIWDAVRFFVALKIAPAPWVKLFVSFITGAFVNYLYYTTFAYTLLQILLKM